MKFGVTNLQYMSGEFNFGSYQSSVTATLLKPKFVTSPTSLPEKKSSSCSTNWQVRDEINIDFYNTSFKIFPRVVKIVRNKRKIVSQCAMCGISVFVIY